MKQLTTSATVLESCGQWRWFCSLPHVQCEATSYLDGKMNLYCSPVKHCETNLQQLNHIKECQNSWLFNHIMHTDFGTCFCNGHFVSVCIAEGNSGNFVFQQGVNAPHCITWSNLPHWVFSTDLNLVFGTMLPCLWKGDYQITQYYIILFVVYKIRTSFYIIHVLKHWVNRRIRYCSNATKKLRCYKLWDWCAPCDMKHILNIII